MYAQVEYTCWFEAPTARTISDITVDVGFRCQILAFLLYARKRKNHSNFFLDGFEIY